MTTDQGAGSAAQPVFRLLGVLEVHAASGPVFISPGRQQAVLAMMLLEPNKVVGIERLVDMLWDHDPPDTARTQVQICVSRLRKNLTKGGLDTQILTQTPGYLLKIDLEQIDSWAFAAEVARGRTLADSGDATAAVAVLREALELWRGPALSGLNAPGLRSRALRLDEERLDTSETLFALELDLGHHHRLIGVLTRLVHEYPLRERLRGQLMLALHRSGRQSEALDVYHQGRRQLAAELGLDPGEELRGLATAILADDPVLRPAPSRVLVGASEGRPGPDGASLLTDAPPAFTRPRQLPADTADYVADPALLATAEAALGAGPARNGLDILVITGAPGVGKSSLATHVAHRLATEHFPDGQLYCDLSPGRGEPDDSFAVLGRFLHALGIPGSMIPDTGSERTAMYRTLLADRRVLVVVDDAMSEGQVTPLLPGGSGCAMIVTSRSRLTGIPGARALELTPLHLEQALELLRRVAGPERVEAEPETAVALLDSIGRLPLAVRIVAARLAARRHWTLASMLQRLTDERHRLDELTYGELTIRASLSLTHNGLDAEARRLFALLALVEGPTMPGWVAAALLDRHVRYPPDLLEPLIDVQMLDVVSIEAGGGLRYRFQDIIRLYAREKLEAEPEAARLAALARLNGGWLAIAERAHRGVYGGDYTILHGAAERWQAPDGYLAPLLAAPLDWLDNELGNLTAAVRASARAGLDELCWDLAVTSVTLFEARGHLDDWESSHEEALNAVRAAGNLRGTAALLASLGTLHINRGRPGRSHAALTSALSMFEELDEPEGRALCHRDLGLLRRQAGDDDGALEHYQLALSLFARTEDVVGRAIVLTQRAHILSRRDRLAESYADLDEAMDIQQSLGYTGGIVRTMRRIGQLNAQTGDYGSALETFGKVLELVREDGDVIGEAHLLRDLGEANEAAGRRAAARTYYAQALTACEQVMNDRGAASVALALARVLARDGEAAAAIELLRKAVTTFREAGMTRQQTAAERQLERLILED